MFEALRRGNLLQATKLHAVVCRLYAARVCGLCFVRLLIIFSSLQCTLLVFTVTSAVLRAVCRQPRLKRCVVKFIRLYLNTYYVA